PVGDVARQGVLLVVEKIVIDEDPFSSAGPVADCGAPDKFGFADPLPDGVGAPGVPDHLDAGRNILPFIRRGSRRGRSNPKEDRQKKDRQPQNRRYLFGMSRHKKPMKPMKGY